MTDGSMISAWLGMRTFFSTVVPLALIGLPALLLVLSGAPGQVDLGRGLAALLAWGPAELVLAAVVLLVATLTVQPLLGLSLQAWASSGLIGLGRKWHRSRRRRLVERTQSTDVLPVSRAAAWRATQLWHRRYPVEQSAVVRSALGNALVAAGERGLARHGLDPAVAWPRLYPLLPPNVRALVDDRRAVLDVTVALVPAWLLCGAVWGVLLVPSGSPLLWFTAVPVVFSVITYRAAISRAAAHGEAVEVAFDLCRKELYTLAGVTLPADREAELVTARDVNAWLGRSGG